MGNEDVGRFNDSDSTFASRMRQELTDGAAREAGVIRQLAPGDVVVLKLEKEVPLRAVESFRNQIEYLMEQPEWRGVRLLILPSFVELIEVRGGREEGADGG